MSHWCWSLVALQEQGETDNGQATALWCPGPPQDSASCGSWILDPRTTSQNKPLFFITYLVCSIALLATEEGLMQQNSARRLRGKC
jgi:hypothetical protein